jgi:hypothetical protein
MAVRDGDHDIGGAPAEREAAARAAATRGGPARSCSGLISPNEPATPSRIYRRHVRRSASTGSGTRTRAVGNGLPLTVPAATDTGPQPHPEVPGRGPMPSRKLAHIPITGCGRHNDAQPHVKVPPSEPQFAMVPPIGCAPAAAHAMGDARRPPGEQNRTKPGRAIRRPGS